jgi:Glycosyl transferase family 11
MIIVVDTEGQLCNRLWGFLPLLHHHRMTGERIRVLFFDAYKAEFPALTNANELRCLRLLPDGVVYKKVGIAVRRLLKNGSNRHDQSLQHKGVCSIVIGWDHRNEEHDENTRMLAVRLFRPRNSVVNTVNHFFDGLRGKGRILLGVHIRKRDYKDFHEGRFFYNDAEYLSFMLQIKQQVERMGYTLSCFICSDEPIDVSNFQGVQVHFMPQASPMEDLYALSCCDLIVGPPSTFSQWASYYGQIPLKLMWDKTAPINVTDFGVCTRLDQTRSVDMTDWLGKRSRL